MHELAGVPDLAAEGLDDRLVAEADAERRRAWGQAAQDRERLAGGRGATRAWRDDEVGGSQAVGLVGVDLVVAADDDLGAELAEHVREVVREAVVIVDQQDHRRASASSIARSSAASFFRHSSCSSAGTESATIPAPACRCATPSLSTSVLIAMQVSSVPPGSE